MLDSYFCFITSVTNSTFDISVGEFLDPSPSAVPRPTASDTEGLDCIHGMTTFIIAHNNIVLVAFIVRARLTRLFSWVVTNRKYLCPIHKFL